MILNGVKIPTTGTEAYSVSYSQFAVALVKAMQEQQKMIDDLKKESIQVKPFAYQQ